MEYISFFVFPNLASKYSAFNTKDLKLHKFNFIGLKSFRQIHKTEVYSCILNPCFTLNISNPRTKVEILLRL